MAKITFQDALPRRSLYEDMSAKPPKGFTQEKDVHVLSPSDTSGSDILSAARAEAADILAKARADAAKMAVCAGAPSAKMAVATPAVPVLYLDWIARIGLSAAEAAALLGVPERTAYRWASKPDTLPPLASRVLAFIEHNGLTASRTILSGVDADAS